MASALFAILTDFTTMSLLATATATAAYSAYRANEALLKRSHPGAPRSTTSLSEQLIDGNSRVLESSMAIAFPVVATISIIFLFFFLRSIGFILTTIFSFTGFFSLSFLLWPLGESIVRRLHAARFPVRTGGTAETAIVIPLASTIVVIWLYSGHWAANNAMGIALCVLFTSLCKVPNLRVTAIVFAGLFVYDVFFVFFSEHVFGSNVMVEVATTEPTNPVYAVASYLNLPVSPVKTLALPAKLVLPGPNGGQTILGLGDIILPAILLVYLLEIDIRGRTAPRFSGYFVRALIAFLFGLIASYFFNYTFRVAQPALLYIVPSLLVPTLWSARRRDQLQELWNGPDRSCSADSLDADGSSHDSQTENLGPSKSEETTSLVAQL